MAAASTDPSDPAITELLRAWTDAEPRALERLVPVIVDDLRRLADHHVRQLGSTPTLQPTALVSEAYLRLTRVDRASFPSRAHFFAFASKLIRDLLVDQLRRRRARKRGGDVDVVTLGAVSDASPANPLSAETVLAIHELLATLERRDPQRAEVVELRYFGGLKMTEIAEVTKRSLTSVERDWRVTRRWLARELGDL